MEQRRARTVARGQQYRTCADTSESAFVRPERVLYGNVFASAPISIVTRALARVRVLTPLSAQIVRRQRRKRGDNNLKMTVSHSRIPQLNAEWEFSVNFLHIPSPPRHPKKCIFLLGMGFHALLGY